MGKHHLLEVLASQHMGPSLGNSQSVSQFASRSVSQSVAQSFSQSVTQPVFGGKIRDKMFFFLILNSLFYSKTQFLTFSDFAQLKSLD